MNEFDRTTRNIILFLFASCLILLVFGYFIRNTTFMNTTFGEVSYLVYASGVLLGIGFSIIKLLMIRFSLSSVITKSKNKATLMSAGHNIFRLILTGVIIYISMMVESLDAFGTILGLIALQPSSYFAGILIAKNVEKDKVMEIKKELDI